MKTKRKDCQQNVKNNQVEIKKRKDKILLDLPYHIKNWNVLSTTKVNDILSEFSLLVDKLINDDNMIIISNDSRQDKKTMKKSTHKKLNDHFVFGFKKMIQILHNNPLKLDLVVFDDVNLPILMDDLVKMCYKKGVSFICIPGLSELIRSTTKIISSTLCLGIKCDSKLCLDFVKFAKNQYYVALQEKNIILDKLLPISTYLPVNKLNIPKKP